jgi:hypothetical protein
MESLYYISMLIGVVWLILWAALPEGSRQRAEWWWPYDMADDAAPAQPARDPMGRSRNHGPAAAGQAAPHTSRRIARAAAPWRRGS